jgi:nucleotide-binding universal stress UspA family protein
VFPHVLLGYDGSPGSRQALTAALELCATSGGRLTVVIVQHHLPRFGATVGEVDEERLLDAAEARRLGSEVHAAAAERRIAVQVVTVPGHPAHEIVRIAKDQHVDLIVVGHSAHPALRGMLLGGVPEHVTRHAPCSVLVVRPRDHDAT